MDGRRVGRQVQRSQDRLDHAAFGDHRQDLSSSAAELTPQHVEREDALEQNLGGAQLALGMAHANGEGVPKNSAEAVKWYRRAANQELTMAQYLLGKAYAEGAGVEKNDAEAAGWYGRAANQGFGLAQYALGKSYADGAGVTCPRGSYQFLC